MKICILSMQNVPNFGSLLQAYSLKKILEEMGHTVSFIDIERNSEEDAYVGNAVQVCANEGERKQGLLSKVKKIDKYFFNRLTIKQLNRSQEELFRDFRSNILKIVGGGYENRQHYDICIIGSDEVFNCLNKSEWGFTSQLFENVWQADDVITYAASCGFTRLENVPATVKEIIRGAFRRVSAISVRDENSRIFAQSLTDKEIVCHLDPVLVGDFTKEMHESPFDYEEYGRYCIVYAYYNRFSEKEDIEAITDFCKEKKLRIIAIGAPQKWIKEFPVLTPFQMLNAFAHASFVITDTFHGTIFASKYTDRFAVITRESNSNKLNDLIGRLSIEDHRITTLKQLPNAYRVVNDKARIEQLSNSERTRTKEYLVRYTHAQEDQNENSIKDTVLIKL